MGIRKFGTAEDQGIIPEDPIETKTASKSFTDRDREELDRENQLDK